MRVLFDTNIILDLFLDRPPFAEEAAELLAKLLPRLTKEQE
jgi:predicted nucleic acid-binding protein